MHYEQWSWCMCVCVCLAMIDWKKTKDQKKGIKDGQGYSNRFSSIQLFEPPSFVNRTRNRLHVELRLICRSPNDKIETKLLDNSEPHYCQTWLGPNLVATIAVYHSPWPRLRQSEDSTEERNGILQVIRLFDTPHLRDNKNIISLSWTIRWNCCQFSMFENLKKIVSRMLPLLSLLSCWVYFCKVDRTILPKSIMSLLTCPLT